MGSRIRQFCGLMFRILGLVTLVLLIYNQNWLSVQIMDKEVKIGIKGYEFTEKEIVLKAYQPFDDNMKLFCGDFCHHVFIVIYY